MVVDRNGEFFDPFTWAAIAAVSLGATNNVISNWDAITQDGSFNIGKFAGFAAIGGASAASNLLWPGYGGAAIGGFIQGFGNTLLRGGNLGQGLGSGLISSSISVASF